MRGPLDHELGPVSRGAGPSAPAVIREILRFHTDDEGDFVAELSCLHNQHVRHRPPFQERSWVLDERSREAHVGSVLDCPLCDRAELPGELVLKTTAGPFDEHTIPPGLRRSHRTPRGQWGVLRILEGAVQFRLDTTPPIEIVLAAGAAQPIPPETLHDLAVSVPVRLVVEFWGR